MQREEKTGALRSFVWKARHLILVPASNGGPGFYCSLRRRRRRRLRLRRRVETMSRDPEDRRRRRRADLRRRLVERRRRRRAGLGLAVGAFVAGLGAVVGVVSRLLLQGQYRSAAQFFSLQRGLSGAFTCQKQALSYSL